MNLTVSTEFARAIAQVHAATENKKADTPILTHLLIAADAATQTVTVSGTNRSISVRRTLPAEVTESGSRAIPGEKLCQITRALPGDEKTVLQQSNDDQLALTCLRSQFRLKTLAPDEFPEFPTVSSEDWLTIPATALADIVRKTTFATSKEGTRPELQGISLKSTAKALVAAATNGHRLAVTKYAHTNGHLFVDVLIPSKALEAACRFGLEGSGDLRVGFTEKRQHMILMHNDFVVAALLTDAHFPDYQHIIPTDSQHTITVGRETLKAALRGLVPLVGTLKHVRCSVNTATPALELVTQDGDFGEGRIEMDAVLEGGADPFFVSPTYLLDFLDKTGTEQVRFHLNGTLDPIRVESIGDPDYTYIVMPMRGN
jgi:DNA polymerase-3 subunit beta